MKIKYILYIFLSFSVTIFFSCKKFVNIDPPINSIQTSQVFADSIGATSAVSGLYISMSQPLTGIMSSSLTIYTGLSSDELLSNTQDPTENEFSINKISVLNSYNAYNLWTPAYKYIYETNAIIEGLNTADKIKNSTRQQLIGEMKFCRAFIYFNLVNIYGKVPLLLSTDYTINSHVGNTETSLVYDQIISDLKEAENSLSTVYIGTGKIRPNKWTATALLAKVYLYTNRWLEAEQAASRVINSGDYNLNTDLNEVFLANSTEAIFQLYPVNIGNETNEGYFFIPTSSDIVPSYTIADQLLLSFEVNDNRKSSWLNKNTINATDYFYPFKYKLSVDGSSVPLEYYMILRLGELYLVRAEARAKQGNITAGKNDINVIRNRAGLPNTTAIDQVSLLIAIMHERQTELFCEWGNRWFDLKRSGEIDNTLSAIKPQWTNSASLFPIPLNEIQKNAALIQNPGY